MGRYFISVAGVVSMTLGLLACKPDSQPTTASTSPTAATPPRQETKPATPLPDTTLLAAWQQFDQAIRAHDTLALQRLLDPAVGLWVLEQPGAMPRVTHVAHVRDFRRDYQSLPLFSLAEQLMTCSTPLVVKQLPAFDCGMQTDTTSGYARDGCFVSSAAEFRRLDVWPYATVVGGTAAEGQGAQRRAMRTILQTRFSFKFHFAKSADGTWRLVFLDLRIPCSA
ncbi:hypothetical protein [Hymenobacter sp. BT730]|uniref:hypothetical protein n=1 Tax=Hymenobacter sp. BT730 TaxID=3063332 RepID=UPI0026DFA6EB|nr:hypothetical protein [Hymenobacter sp. BT730]